MNEKATRILHYVLVALLFVAMVALRAGLVDPRAGLICLGVASALLFGLNQWIAGRYREYEFKDGVSMPAGIAKLEKQNVSFLRQLGFSHLGDYRLLPEPRSHHVKLYLSPGKKCFCEFSQLAHFVSPSFVSVAGNGTYLESANFAIPETRPDLPMRLFSKPKASFVELFRFHREQVEQYCLENQTELLTLSKDVFPDVARYGHSLASIDLKKKNVQFARPESLFARTEDRLAESLPVGTNDRRVAEAELVESY